MIITFLFGIAGGIFSFCGAFFQWNFFTDNAKYKGFVKIFGENGARLFYMVLGIFLIVLSLIMVFRY